MKPHTAIVALLAAAGAAYAFVSPAPVPLGSPIEHTEELTTTGTSQETAFIAFDQFDPALGTLDSIEFGVRIEAHGYAEITDDDGQRDDYFVSCSGCGYPFGDYPDADELGQDGVSYHSLTARVGAAPAGNKITRYNYIPVHHLVERGNGETHRVTIDDPDVWVWSGPYTDSQLLSDFTGTATKRVYGDFGYSATFSGGFDEFEYDFSDYRGFLGVRYNYH